MKRPNVGELCETLSVAEANGLLKTGWQLLEIVPLRRGPLYVLGVQTAAADTAAEPPALPAKS